MPTYLYECENCGRFEEFQKITDEPLAECPDCGGDVKRIIGAPGVIFKGSGFYSTDHGSGNTTAAEPKSQPEADKEKVENNGEKEKVKNEEKAS